MKMITAKVDTCHQNRIDNIHQTKIKVAFAENTQDQLLNEDIQNKGIEHFKALKKEALSQGAKIFTGVATAALRQAKNAPQFLARVKDETGITITLISQNEEAVLGYEAATANVKDPSINTVVWDIGGNSMQITMQSRDQKYLVYCGDMASISFKNKILETIQHQSLDNGDAPKPIGRENLAAALEIAMNAAADVPDEIKSYLHQPGARIIGIGGVHNQSIRKQLGNATTYRREDLSNILQSKLDLTHTHRDGPYAYTEISNLILVLGFMEKLGIEKVELSDVGLVNGILIDPAFW
jgi:exopolyphosphatase/guanosine-5'-triphosphate,3'-diphosphate pyrophosphatase